MALLELRPRLIDSKHNPALAFNQPFFPFRDKTCPSLLLEQTTNTGIKGGGREKLATNIFAAERKGARVATVSAGLAEIHLYNYIPLTPKNFPLCLPPSCPT